MLAAGPEVLAASGRVGLVGCRVERISFGHSSFGRSVVKCSVIIGFLPNCHWMPRGGFFLVW